MKAIESYKALSYNLLIYGFKPIDLVIIFISFVLIHGVFYSLWIDFMFLVPSLMVSWKFRKRPERYFTSLMVYFLVPSQLSVPIMDNAPRYLKNELKNGFQHD